MYKRQLKELSFFDDIDMIPFIGYTGIIQGVRVGIELAVMDLIGKIEEKPVYRLFNTEEFCELTKVVLGCQPAFLFVATFLVGCS